jgi:hypothetical protein
MLANRFGGKMIFVPFVRVIVKSGEARNPKAYKIKYVMSITPLGQQRGEGWYILTPSHDFVGPLTTQETAENVLISALEELRGKPISKDERQKAHELWDEH